MGTVQHTDSLLMNVGELILIEHTDFSTQISIRWVRSEPRMDKIRENFFFTASVCLDVDLGSQFRSLCGTANSDPEDGHHRLRELVYAGCIQFASLRFTSLQFASGPSFQRVCVRERPRGASGRKGPKLEVTAQ